MIGSMLDPATGYFVDWAGRKIEQWHHEEELDQVYERGYDDCASGRPKRSMLDGVADPVVWDDNDTSPFGPVSDVSKDDRNDKDVW